MNISEAKEQIKNAVASYLTKDEFDRYVIPIEKQRPVFLVGAPGIGKTAIMEQIAEELGIGLVSYSMTHHTRQSALGLPYITKKVYGGKEYQVSEYTMSEIIASVYDMMEESGLKEGILFLDEINCVSETLAPSMLQFLQFKTFGRHRIPDGWIVVTAGNPPEYNQSVREFDIVTMDRLKCMEVEPDYKAWKSFAIAHGVHPAVLSYLEIKKDYFYDVETTVDGKIFVTARGWDDLSEMIRLYEKKNMKVDEALISQYLHHPKIAKDFASYYDLFHKYRTDYQIDRILAGTVGDEIKKRAKSARFDERIALTGLLLDAVTEKAEKIQAEEKYCLRLNEILRILKKEMESGSLADYLEKGQEAEEKRLNAGMISKSMPKEELLKTQRVIRFFEEELIYVRRKTAFLSGTQEERMTSDKHAFDKIKKDYAQEVSALRRMTEDLSEEMRNLFFFCESVFQDGQEMLVLVTELTMNPAMAGFISHYDCPEYYKHSKKLMFQERNREIVRKLKELDFDS